MNSSVTNLNSVSMIVLLLLFTSGIVRGLVYDSYRGWPITADEYIQHVKDNTTFWCINAIAPCDPEGWRKIDGSCNNLKHPSRGAMHTPQYRILPGYFDKHYEPKNAKSGQPLPLTRRVRTTLLSENRVSDPQFTMLAAYFLVFVASDITNLHDTVNYILWTPYCCDPKVSAKIKKEHGCAPITVPADDPVLRYTDVRCLNLTKPLTFQSQGCISKRRPPSRIVTATPLFDLSTIYGNTFEENIRGRKFEGGQLRVEIDDGKVWPPSRNNADGICIQNRPPREKRCFRMPTDDTNTLMGIGLGAVWFWRYHNVIAEKLEKINPHWDDETLFYTARDINIAIYSQIVYYEILPMLMGFDNLAADGIIVPSMGFRDMYDKTLTPKMALEFPMTLRWLHLLQEGIIKLYDPHGNIVDQIEIGNTIARTGWLVLDNNIYYITQGSFRQASAYVDDHIVDPEMAERGTGPIQPVLDVTTNDVTKDRLDFLQPYVKYSEYCSGIRVHNFEDLKRFFKPEVLEKLQSLYENVGDIDFLAAMWVENVKHGARVPNLFYCIVAEQLLYVLRSDRHWYERPNRPHAFTSAQLGEIRKASISRILCDVGDSVTHIQRNAFQRIGHGNELISCDIIPDINLNFWQEYS